MGIMSTVSDTAIGDELQCKCEPQDNRTADKLHLALGVESCKFCMYMYMYIYIHVQCVPYTYMYCNHHNVTLYSP